MRGTLTELSQLPEMPSLPTLRAMIKADPEFPGITKLGDKGDAYEIDLPVAVAYIRAQRDREAEERRSRGDALSQMALELGLEAPKAEAAGFSVADRKALLEEEIVALKLARMRGELVAKPTVEAAMSTLLVWLQQRDASFPARLARRLHLSREQQIEVEQMIAADQMQIVERMKGLAEVQGYGDGDAGEPFDAAAPAVDDPAA